MTIDLDKMTPIAEPQVKARGLSYSSFTEYSACARKWWIRKVAKLPIDADADASTAAFDIGKFFHRVLEITNHNLSGVTFQKCVEVGKEFNVTDTEDLAMVFAMLKKYRELHEASGMKVLACETVIDAPNLYGVVDATMQDSEGKIWIIDIKSAGMFQQSTLQSISTNVQLNLYAYHFDIIAHAIGMKDALFGGVRLRTTTKSKLKMKSDEPIADYINRMAKGIKSSDIIVPASELKNMGRIFEQHRRAHLITSKATLEDEANFPPNFGNCTAWFRACEHWKKCHGYNYTEAPKVTMVEV